MFLSPLDTEMRIDHWDCRNGGSYQYLRVIDGEEYGFRGCFHEVRPPELIVQTFSFEGVEHGVREGYERLDIVLSEIE